MLALLVVIAALIVAVVASALICLWWLVGGNVAGWVTTVVAFLTGMFVAELLGAEQAFSRLTKRGQRIVIAVAVVVAAGGSVGYVLLPGTASWYLSALPAFPLLLILTWLRGDDEPELGPIDFSDGPWTAP